mmetsp:Transcript_3638/g.7592  ORF Transcript_3638/g.7592 Transcript_3638/m.7592 type:complete len:208 (-) Transcript_3638:325-948(-)
MSPWAPSVAAGEAAATTGSSSSSSSPRSAPSASSSSSLAARDGAAAAATAPAAAPRFVPVAPAKYEGSTAGEGRLCCSRLPNIPGSFLSSRDEDSSPVSSVSWLVVVRGEERTLIFAMTGCCEVREDLPDLEDLTDLPTDLTADLTADPPPDPPPDATADPPPDWEDPDGGSACWLDGGALPLTLDARDEGRDPTLLNGLKMSGEAR